MLRNLLPTRLVPIPADELEKLLPTTGAVRVTQIYAGDMQPDRIFSWSIAYTRERIARKGAFYCSGLAHANAEKMAVGIPTDDGGMCLLMDEAKSG